MARKTRGRPQPSPLASDLEDEVDKFHKKRDKLSLDVNQDALSESDGSLDEEGVLDISDEDGSDFSGTDEDSEEDDEHIGHLRKLAKQAKTLQAKLRIDRGEDEEGDDEEEDGDAQEIGGARWGKSKRAYYDADVADLQGSDDEEALKDEEEEAVRLQREAAAALHPADFGQEESGEEEEEDERADADGELTLRAATANAGGAVQGMGRELSAMDREARAAAVRQDALELTALVAELRATLGEVRGRLGPLLQEVQSGGLATAEGVSYLEAKHTLLLHYAACIVFYLLLKAEGRPVRDHPVVARLVEVRAYLDKVRPIDKRLQYQIEKLLAAALQSKRSGDDAAAVDEEGDGGALRHGPRPEALLPREGGVAAADPDGGEEAAEQATGRYVAPRLNPVSMEMDAGTRDSARERRRAVQGARRASRSSLVQELAAELAGAPDEHRAAGPVGMDTAAALRARQRLAAREEVEEGLMVRVPLSKEERKQLKAHRRAGLSGQGLLDDFADDVADLVAGGIGAEEGFGHHLASQRFGGDLTAEAEARRSKRSGDADLPVRESLSDRRSKMQSAQARRAVQASAGFGEEDGEFFGGGKGAKRQAAGGEEDDFYKEMAAAAAGKKQRRKEAHERPATLPPMQDAEVAGARRINTAMEKNRGLTPHRRRDMKNPRKKHRVKFAEAQVRRKGQVQAVRAGEAAKYGGEGTGIKSRVSKSVKF